MIKLVNCKDLFSECLIDDVKKNIDTYHQGFVLIGDELYLPHSRVINLELEYDVDLDVNAIMLDDMSQVTATDKLSCDFEAVLDLCYEAYWQGYDDGYKA